MAYKTPLQTLKDEQDFYKGLENSFILAPEVLQQVSSEFEGYDIKLIQKQIMESPSDVQLDRLMRGKLYEDFIFIFLYQALAQALQYNSRKDLTIIDLDDIPNMYFLDDVDVLYDELKTIPQVGREKLFNHYSNVNPNSLAMYKKAIMELDKDSLVRIMESQDIDIVWMQKLLGYFHYNKSINDVFFNGEISWDDSSILVRKILGELPNDDKEPDPYYVEWRANQKKICDAAQNSELGEELPDDILSVMASLYLKSYWFGCSEYDAKSRQIIDNYINKPCFSDFVSKCRAEFEEEERLREEESVGGEIVDTDTEPVVEEVQKQAPQSAYIDDKEKIFTFAPNVNAVNLFPESEYAFNGSKGLAEYAINNKEKIECFVHLLANKFHYIPKDKKHARAFVRTITGIKCDGGIIKPILQSREAVEAILYMAQQHILPGNLKDALQKFDIKEGVDIKPMKINPSSYAGRADNEFIKLAADVFSDYCRQKQTKQYEDCAFLIL